MTHNILPVNNLNELKEITKPWINRTENKAQNLLEQYRALNPNEKKEFLNHLLSFFVYDRTDLNDSMILILTNNELKMNADDSYSYVEPSELKSSSIPAEF